MSFSRYLILFAVSILVYHFAFSCFICVFLWSADFCLLRSFAIFLGFVWFVQFSMPHLINTEQMEQDLQKLCSIFPFRDLCFSCIDVYVLLLFRVLLTVACVSCISSKFHCFLSCFCIYCVLFLCLNLFCTLCQIVLYIVQWFLHVWLACPRPLCSISTTQTKDRQKPCCMSLFWRPFAGGLRPQALLTSSRLERPTRHDY